MPERKSSSAGSRGSARSKKSNAQKRKPARAATERKSAAPPGLSAFVEQLANRVIKPLGLVLLSPRRIQETLDEAAERGRVTRSDANELAAELIRRGRQETDDLLSNIEQLFGRGRQQLESARKRARDPVSRLVRGDNAEEESTAVLPILEYDEMTAGQVEGRLEGLTPGELRAVRNYERRHANRKSVLAAIERGLA
jgi:polyhydroxyalkanoate synthesis regulator phasin